MTSHDHPAQSTEPSGEQPAPPQQPVPLADLVAATSGDEPALTWRGGGERVELGWATLRNWAEKVAGWLRDDVEREPGDVLAVDVGDHWVGVAAILGAWRARLAVRLGPPEPGEAAVVAQGREEGCAADPEALLVVGPGGFGLPAGTLADGEPFNQVITVMPDESQAPRPSEGDVALLTPQGSVTQAAVSRAAHVAAVAAGTRQGLRLASVVPTDSVDGLVTGPLAAWASHGPAVLLSDGLTDDTLGQATAEHARLLVARPEQAEALQPAAAAGAGADGQHVQVVALVCTVEDGLVRVRPA